MFLRYLLLLPAALLAAPPTGSGFVRLAIDAPEACMQRNVASGAGRAASSACPAVGPQHVLVLPVHNPAATPPALLTQSFLEDVFFGPKSLAGYWAEASYGRVSVSGRVLPWKPLSRAFACTETFPLLDETLRLFDPEVDFREYTRVVIVWPRPSGCTWTGMALLDSLSKTTADGPVSLVPVWLNAGTMTTSTKALQLAVHELGHTLGLEHANARDHALDPVGPIGAAGAIVDYGDPFSAMGAWNTGHYDARQKLQIGWLDPSQVAEAESGGTWTLEPMTAPQSGLKALKVRRAENPDAWFWLEFRQKAGLYDSTLPSNAFTGLLVRYQDRWTGAKSELLDFTPATTAFTDAALAKARSWTDSAAGLTIKVNSVSTTAASVTLDFGAGTCTRTPPVVTLTPAKLTATPGSPVSFTASIANSDSVSCPLSSFTLTSPLSPGLPSLLLNPGQTTSTVLPLQAPASPGAYTIELTVRQNTTTIKAKATLTVLF